MNVQPIPLSALAAPPPASGAQAPAGRLPGAANTAQGKAPLADATAKHATEQLQEAVQATNAFVKPINSEIQFSIDKETGTTVVKVTNVATREVIRQIPSEEMLNIARALNKIQGLLLKQQA